MKTLLTVLLGATLSASALAETQCPCDFAGVYAATVGDSSCFGAFSQYKDKKLKYRAIGWDAKGEPVSDNFIVKKNKGNRVCSWFATPESGSTNNGAVSVKRKESVACEEDLAALADIMSSELAPCPSN
jgi:hypothetical protein